MGKSTNIPNLSLEYLHIFIILKKPDKKKKKKVPVVLEAFKMDD